MDDKKQTEAIAPLGDEYNRGVARKGFCHQVLPGDIVANKTNTTATATATATTQHGKPERERQHYGGGGNGKNDGGFGMGADTDHAVNTWNAATSFAQAMNNQPLTEEQRAEQIALFGDSSNEEEDEQ